MFDIIYLLFRAVILFVVGWQIGKLLIEAQKFLELKNHDMRNKVVCDSCFDALKKIHTHAVKAQKFMDQFPNTCAHGLEAMECTQCKEKYAK